MRRAHTFSHNLINHYLRTKGLFFGDSWEFQEYVSEVIRIHDLFYMFPGKGSMVTAFSLIGMGFSNPQGISALSDAHLTTGFYVLIFAGLASVGLVDLFNKDDSVSHT